MDKERMTDQEAIVWLKTRIGNLKGCSVVEKDEVYALAVNALEGKRTILDGNALFGYFAGLLMGISSRTDVPEDLREVCRNAGKAYSNFIEKINKGTNEKRTTHD